MTIQSEAELKKHLKSGLEALEAAVQRNGKATLTANEAAAVFIHIGFLVTLSEDKIAAFAEEQKTQQEKENDA